MLSFTERMAQGRETAQDKRNRGEHTGKCAAGWNYKRPIQYANDNCAWLNHWRKEWHRQCAEIINGFRSAALNGPDDKPETWDILL